MKNLRIALMYFIRSILNDLEQVPKIRPIKILLSCFLLVAISTSCTSVKGYQKMYLNDEEMDLAARKIEYFETNFQTYREGASGANGGKVGGGCGCN